MTVGQLLHNVNSRELSEWMAYFEIENEDLQKMKNKSGPDSGLEDKLKGTFTAMSLTKGGK